MNRLKPVLVLAAAVAFGVFTPGAAQAHFLWLTGTPDQKQPTVQAFLSETPMPDLPEFLKTIAKAKVSAEGKELSWTKAEDSYRINLPEPRPAIVDGFCDLGIKKRNDVAFRLLYTARVQYGPAAAGSPELTDHLRVRLVDQGGGKPVVVATFRGKPAPGVTLKVYPESGDVVERKTDDNGRFEDAAVAEGRSAILAKWIDKVSGEREGTAFAEERYYATLTVVPVAKPVAQANTPPPFALLPEPVNSFGGAVLGDWLYVYSGHLGKTHTYHSETTSKHFRRLNLRDRTTWQDLPPGPPLQGVALVAHRESLYRVGGMSAKNKPGEPNDLTSVADFARFDVKTSTWTNLPPLPAPRSTHDAVVVGDTLYVVGGWNMEGGGSENAEFCTDALSFNLVDKDAGWQALPAPPFRRRALAAASLHGKVYVLGGLTDGMKVVKAVDVYDPAAKTWSTGPEIPGGKLQGFAPSAFEVAGHLYLTGKDGTILRLNDAGDRWDTLGQLALPRLTHRLLPGIEGDLLVVGGNAAGTATRVIESIPLKGLTAQTVKTTQLDEKR